jgi:putative sporulation protein YtaF
MHPFLSTVAIALANNVDNLSARVAYSLGAIKIGLSANLWITAITFVVSLFAAVMGAELTHALGSSFSSWASMTLLVTLGAWMIVQPRLKVARRDGAPRKRCGMILGVLLRPEAADADESKHIDFKEATILGIALSINNVGGGMTAGMLGLNPLLVATLSALLSFLALWAGNHAAEFLGRRERNGRLATVGGVLLIAIGIRQIF